MKIRIIYLYIFLSDDAHFGYGIQQGNILPSLSHIPGGVVRGALAGWAIRNGFLKSSDDDFFKKLFIPDDTTESKISFPNCYHRQCLPSPFSLYEAKGTPVDPQTISVREPFKVYPNEDLEAFDGAEKFITDFLLRTEWPSDITFTTFTPFSGRVDTNGRLVPPAPMVIDLKAHHDEENERVGKEGLFAEEGVPAASRVNPWRNVYAGSLNFEDKPEVVELFSSLMDDRFSDHDDRFEIPIEDPEPNHLFLVGHRRVAGVIYGIDGGAIDTETEKLPDEFDTIEDHEPITFTFLSDCILPECSFPLTEAFFNNLIPDSECEKKRVFCKRSTIYGFNTVTGKHRHPMTSLAAGSCGAFFHKMDHNDLRILWAHSLLGYSLRNRDGYGRFKINWDIHQVSSKEEP